MCESAVDIALWDPAARPAGLPLSRLIGQVHETVDVYGSGGFTTLTNYQLREQLEDWVLTRGIPRVKIKIGESWGHQEHCDLARVRIVRSVVGDDVDVFTGLAVVRGSCRRGHRGWRVRL